MQIAFIMPAFVKKNVIALSMEGAAESTAVFNIILPIILPICHEVHNHTCFVDFVAIKLRHSIHKRPRSTQNSQNVYFVEMASEVKESVADLGYK